MVQKANFDCMGNFYDDGGWVVVVMTVVKQIPMRWNAKWHYWDCCSNTWKSQNIKTQARQWRRQACSKATKPDAGGESVDAGSKTKRALGGGG
jgi:hypothetical protein